MKALACSALLLSSSACCAASADAWFRDWPAGVEPKEISSSHVAEVPHSLFDAAQDLLKDKAALRIGDNYFPGFRYQWAPGSNAYLVRALYEHGNNGEFQVARSGNDLLVRHEALGGPGTLHRSAVVVCLNFVPQEVYVATGGAL